MPPSLSLLKTSFNLKPSIFDDLKGAQNDHKTSILIDELVLNEKITEVVSKDSREHPWANSNEDSSKKSSSLRKGPVGFMVLSVRNTAAPKVSPENNFAPRMLKVSVSDGYHTYHLIEVEPIKLLSVDTAPGTKIILTGDLTVRNNLVLIKAANVQFVGGRVEEMYEKWVVTKDFNTKAIRDTGAPKFVPFGRAIDNVKIDKQGKGDTKEEESAEKTETDAKFGAVRDQNLEAVKQLKTEQKGLTSGATAQLPSSDFFHSKKKEPQNGATSSGTTVTMGNTPAPDPFADDPFGGPRGGRGGRGGRRGRKGSDAEYDEGPDDAKFKAPSQQASLFDIIQNKIDDMTVQDIEFSDPNPRPMAPVSTRLGPSSVRNGDTRSVTYERDGQRAGRGYRNERNFNEGSYGGDRGPNGQRVSQRGRGRGNFEDQRTRGDRNSNNGYDRNYNQGGQNVQRNQYQHVDGFDNYPKLGDQQSRQGRQFSAHRNNNYNNNQFNNQNMHNQATSQDYPMMDPNMQQYMGNDATHYMMNYPVNMGMDHDWNGYYDEYPGYQHQGVGGRGGGSYNLEFTPRNRGRGRGNYY